MGGIMEEYRQKIKDITALEKQVQSLRKQGKHVVFTNGVFDILHPGHARYLAAAKDLGDFLIVAVNSDKSARAVKGPNRPINPQHHRAELIAALGFVDAVIIFEEKNPLKVINHLMPDVLVKGGDWEREKIIGGDVVEKAGGRVMRIPFAEGYSTTDIIKKIKHTEK